MRGLQRCSLFTLKYILNNWLTIFSMPQRFVTSSPDLLSKAHVRKHDIICSAAFSNVSPGLPPLLDNCESAFPANSRRSRHTVYMIGKGQLSSFWDDNNLTKN